MKFILKTILICFSFLCFNIIEGQTRTYQITTKFSPRDAYGFKKEHGIDLMTLAQDPIKATVSVKTLQGLTFLANCGSYGRNNLRLYQAYVNSSGDGSLKHLGNKNTYYYTSWSSPSLFKYACRTATTDSYYYCKNMARTADKVIHNSTWFWGKDIDVVITLTLEGGLMLSDIKRVKVPGIKKTFYANDFVNKTNYLTDHDCNNSNEGVCRA